MKRPKELTMEQESLLLEFIEENKDFNSLIESLEKAKIEQLHSDFLEDLISSIKDNPSSIDYLFLI